MRNKKTLAIITARGGSKRIPKKNIKNFLGKPIISYTINSAVKSKLFDEVMVSTDDKKIARVAVKYGAKVPFLRSAKNSGDFASTADVVIEVLSDYQKLGREFDFVCCLYPTAPFVSSKKLIEAKKLMEKSSADTVFSAVSFGFPIQRSFRIGKNSLVRANWPAKLRARSQDLEPMYHDAGQYYFLNTKSFLRQRKVFMRKSRAVITPELEAQDVDNLVDWKIAEIKYKLLTAQNEK